MREPEFDVLYVEEGMPDMQCKHCGKVFGVGDEVIDLNDGLYCSPRCIGEREAMLEDNYWDRRFEEHRSGGY